MVNLPVMFDFWPRPERTYAELLLKKMRPGDIHTHVFAQQFPIILPDGKINPIMAEARARGVIFDVGHGAGSFWFRNAVPAVRQGFIPDSISTDLHTRNYTVLSMTQVMSKFLAMGVPLNEIIRRSTVNPAHEIQRPELGTLSVGKEADIAVLEQLNGKFSYIDCGFARMDGTGKLIGAHDGAGGTHSLRSFRPEHGASGRKLVRSISARPRWARLRRREPTTTRGNERLACAIVASRSLSLANAPRMNEFRRSGRWPCRRPEVRGDFAGADGFNRGNQSRQHRGLREGHVVRAEDELKLRGQSGEALYRSDVVIEIGLWTIKPDRRGIVCVAGEEQAVGAIEQANGIRSVAGSGENFQTCGRQDRSCRDREESGRFSTGRVA